MLTTFGTLLRRFRSEKGLSQALLAERAGISVDAIGAYERELRHAPRRDTIAALVHALQLDASEAATLERTARRKSDLDVLLSEEPARAPHQPTSFVGREQDLNAVLRLVRPGRVLTIVGPGGVGKTRVAIEASLRYEAPSGEYARFVDLTHVETGDFVLGKIASAFGLAQAGPAMLLKAITTAGKNARMLLVLDSCEHVIDAVRSVAIALLQECPSIPIVTTSREPLGIGGEHLYRLAPLVAGDAVTLFLERAQSKRHHLSSRPFDVAIVSEICRRLDGLPLAIELAAARAGLIGLLGLQAQLNKGFHVLGGRYDLPQRQRTVDATIAWSYELLSQTERTLFRRLSIFRGGWTFDAAESVCTDALLEPVSVLDALLSLVEKSLVIADAGERPRYTFLDSTRAFALRELDTANERASLSRRHAEWMAVFSDHIFDAIPTTPRETWRALVAPELDNAIEALDWSFGADGDGVAAARIAGGLQWLWLLPEMADQGKRYVGAALKGIEGRSDGPLLSRLLLAQHRWRSGSEMLQPLTHAASLLDEKLEPALLSRTYQILAYAQLISGQYSDGERVLESALGLARNAELESSTFYASLLLDHTRFLRIRNDLDGARAELFEAKAISERVGDRWKLSQCHIMLALLEIETGDLRTAALLSERALDIVREIDPGTINYATGISAVAHLFLNQLEIAERRARESLLCAQSSMVSSDVISGVHIVAAVAARRGDAHRAAILMGYVDARMREIGDQFGSMDLRLRAVLMESLQAQLNDAEIDRSGKLGARFSDETAASEALACTSGQGDGIEKFA